MLGSGGVSTAVVAGIVSGVIAGAISGGLVAMVLSRRAVDEARLAVATLAEKETETVTGAGTNNSVTHVNSGLLADLDFGAVCDDGSLEEVEEVRTCSPVAPFLSLSATHPGQSQTACCIATLPSHADTPCPCNRCRTAQSPIRLRA